MLYTKLTSIQFPVCDSGIARVMEFEFIIFGILLYFIYLWSFFGAFLDMLTGAKGMSSAEYVLFK